MGILIFILVSYILLSISLMKVFEKAGEPGWKALVPGLNFIVWSKLVGHKSGAYAALLLIPIVNIFIYTGLCVDMVRSFGKYKFWHSAVAVIYAPILFFMLGYKEEEKYLGPTLIQEQEYFAQLEDAEANNRTRQLKKLQAKNPYHKSQAREWVEAIVFAVFAAAFIRMFLIEAYTIPTSSMEGSLMTGDFLFVSKWHYGIRTPETVAMIPLLHNRLPLLDGESYLKKPSLKMHRLPAWESVDRNDPVVFNFPVGDSVYVFPERTWTAEDVRFGAVPQRRMKEIKNGKAKLVTRPIDKKDHYIKRCIGVAGDSLQIINRQVYINGKPAENPTNLQYTYLVQSKNGPFNIQNFSDWGISEEDQARGKDTNTGSMLLILNQEQVDKIKAMDANITVQNVTDYIVSANGGGFNQSQLSKWKIDNANIQGQFNQSTFVMALTDAQADSLRNTANVRPYERNLFPHDTKNFSGWSVDNFGPIYIPKKGATVKIGLDNIALYRRVIDVYEENDLKIANGKIFINGEAATEYTFKMNYYWMMGDNRHNSEDARVWGFVPENHIVGKPLFIWFSTKEGNISKGINWDRIFTSANKF